MILAEARVYLAVLHMAFRRQLAYRTANVAGLLTNAFFGLLRAQVFIALFATATSSDPTQAATIAGYDMQSATTYTWVTQALLMVVSLFAWWDIETTIRSGDVVTDLSRPFSYLGYWLARDWGRAVYFVLFRGAPTLLLGQLTLPGGLRWPEDPAAWALLTLSVTLAVTVSFAWRFAINMSAFWTTDARGLGNVAISLVLFLGGFVVPLRFFPDWIQPLLRALPFAAMIQVPTDIFVGRLSGLAAVAGVATQLVWALAMLAFGQLIVLVAVRRVSLQGG
jgi:ABC-2 type transport system permease protein